ncbi:hypothetical protein TRFO_36580 [Tritrichomonas foetus]|uniref:Transmembrane protein n=1 Tax=Tritrichomonas foetus TaxID=1144522 RepID=A0A1J4JI86_9EUKA|nr:hypothetical protein TRFO_36580 [Tritrichomonas foetus]|eukprot:OHS97229.1 hypothetical protein TRFO_36580 [Tritrichomonas foetus]
MGLKSLYKLYFMIRSKIKPPTAFNFWVLLMNFIQLSSLLVCFLKPTQILYKDDDDSFCHALESTILFLPWIFGNESMIFDSFVYFTMNLLSFGLLYYSAFSINRSKHIDYWCCAIIYFYQVIVAQMLPFIVYYRFSYLVERLVFTEYDLEVLISFIISLLNVLGFAIHIYICSIFLIPMDFVQRGKFDLYDGKYLTVLYFIRLLISMECFFFQYIPNQITQIVTISIFSIICFTVLYFRSSIKVNTSFIAQYIEVSPIAAAPFMMILRIFYNNDILSLILLVVIYILLFIVLYYYNEIIKKNSLKTFLPFSKGTSNFQTEKMPRFILGSVTSMIRIISTENCDPECLVRFSNLQKQTSSKNAIKIEVIRFLALFPERREKCLKELELMSSTSNHNSFTIFLFKKILKRFMKQTTNKHREVLNRLYRSYLVHHHLYWMARKENRWIQSLYEACSVSFYFIETRTEFRSLLDYYQFDFVLHSYFAEFLLSACGDFEGYLKEMKLSQQIENEIHEPFSDPLIHSMSRLFPKILQFYVHQNVPNSNYNNASSLSSNSSSAISSYFNSSEKELRKIKNRNKSKACPVASFLNKSRRWVPMMVPFHVIFPISSFIIMISILYPTEEHILKSSQKLYEDTISLIGTFYLTSATIFVPYILKDFSSINNSLSSDECYQSFLNLPYDMSEFFRSNNLIKNLTTGMIYNVNNHIYEMIYENLDICQIIFTIKDGMDLNAQNLMIDLSNIIQETDKTINLLSQYYENLYSMPQIVIIIIVFFICFGIVSFVILFIQLNKIMNDPIKIDFMSSKSRIYSFLIQEGKQAWELLRNTIPNVEPINSVKHSQSENLPISTIKNTARKRINENFNDEKGVMKVSSSTNILSGAYNMKNGALLQNSAFSILAEEPARSRKSVGLIPNFSFSSETPSIISNTANCEDIHSDESLDLSFIIDDHDIVDHAIAAALTEGKNCQNLHVVLILIFPLIIICIIEAMLLIPMKSRTVYQLSLLSELKEKETQTNASVVLLNFTFSYMMKRVVLLYDIENVEKELNKSGTEIGENYYKDQCYTLDSIICVSIRTIVSVLKNHEASTKQIVNWYMPIIYVFSWHSLNSLYYHDVEGVAKDRISNGISFIVAISILFFVFLKTAISTSALTFDSFNSLYHFPDDFLKVLKGQKNQSQESSQPFPSNALIVTTMNNSDEIYSISENSKVILNRNLFDVISNKFSKSFPIIEKQMDFLREYTAPDKKKKVFRYHSESVGLLTKTVMIEVVSSIPNPREKTYSGRLVEYMPPYFAKKFADDDISEFTFNNAFVICCRIKPNLSFIMIEKFFNIANHLTQRFSSIKICHIDGQMILFTSLSYISYKNILLFIRDLINDSKNGIKDLPDNMALFSLLVDYFSEFQCTVNKIGEPFLDLNPLPHEFRVRLFNLDEGLIAFSSSATRNIPKLSYESRLMYFRQEKLMKIDFSQFNTQFVISQMQ